jgi:hypothetical protein
MLGKCHFNEKTVSYTSHNLGGIFDMELEDIFHVFRNIPFANFMFYTFAP